MKLTFYVPMMMWTEVRRTLKQFVINITSIREEARLESFHASIYKRLEKFNLANKCPYKVKLSSAVRLDLWGCFGNAITSL